MIIGAVIVIAAVLCVVFFWFGINAGARTALREAKDVRIAMKMKAIETYGLGGSVFKASSANGMSEGMEKEILSMADADGTIVLQSWDSNSNEPQAFTYQKDKYIVVFRMSEDGGISWKGYYTFMLLEYTG